MKGLTFSGIVVLMFLLIIGFTQAVTPCIDEGELYNYLVCGRQPNGATGFGAVDVCSDCKPCGVADGICPEDFYSLEQDLQTSCSSCPDPDCTSQVNGRVVAKELSSTGIPDAKVFAFYPPNKKIHIATTTSEGYFSSSQVPSGKILFFAEYGDFDSPTVETLVLRGQSNSIPNIELEQGTCSAECTGTFGLRCKARCNGIAGCQFRDFDSYTSNQIANLCNERLVNERVTLDVTPTQVTYVTCCTGEITVVDRPRVSMKFSEGVKIKDLVTHKVRARYQGETVDVVIAYWTEENN